jgi:hypothetical protein
MTVVDDAIARELALLARLVPVQVAPFGYGRELKCATELDARLASVDYNSPIAIGETLLRRFQTPNGMLDDDREYGEDVRGYVNRGTTSSDLRDYQNKIRREAMKDDRVDVAEAEVTYAAPTLTIKVFITPVDATLGTFALTFAVLDGALMLEALS